jgi:hypothetical protein
MMLSFEKGQVQSGRGGSPTLRKSRTGKSPAGVAAARREPVRECIDSDGETIIPLAGDLAQGRIGRREQPLIGGIVGGHLYGRLWVCPASPRREREGVRRAEGDCAPPGRRQPGVNAVGDTGLYAPPPPLDHSKFTLTRGL